MATTSLASYDEIPYTALAATDSHPRNLRSIALLLGLDAPPHESARVLELGCGTGGNIIPLAAETPGATFVGLDLSLKQIEQGRATAARVGASNLRLEHASITDVTPEWGKFDYIICHGVMSWVPPPVRESVFSICRENLSPRGVAFISFNAHPFWHLRGLVRDMMRFHGQTIEDGSQKARQAEDFLRVLSQSPVMRGKLIGTLVEAELAQMKGKQVNYLLHEYFEDENHPLYFQDFVADAARHGLSYLADAAIPSPVRQLPPDLQQYVASHSAGDAARAEQYADFFYSRAFRRALLTVEPVQADWDGVASRIGAMHITSTLRTDAAAASDSAIRSNALLRYDSSVGGLATPDSRLKAALRALSESFPQSMTFDAVCDAVCKMLNDNRDVVRDALSRAIASLWMVGLLEVYVTPQECVKTPGEKPLAAAAARILVGDSEELTNLRHQTVHVSPDARRLLAFLDGTRSRSDLTRIAPQSDRLVAELARQAFLKA